MAKKEDILWLSWLAFVPAIALGAYALVAKPWPGQRGWLVASQDRLALYFALTVGLASIVPPVLGLFFAHGKRYLRLLVLVVICEVLLVVVLVGVTGASWGWARHLRGEQGRQPIQAMPESFPY